MLGVAICSDCVRLCEAVLDEVGDTDPQGSAAGRMVASIVRGAARARSAGMRSTDALANGNLGEACTTRRQPEVWMIRLKDVVIDCQHPASLAGSGRASSMTTTLPLTTTRSSLVSRISASPISRTTPGEVVGSTAPRLYFSGFLNQRSRRTGCTSIYKPTSPIRRWLESSIPRPGASAT